MWEKQKQPNVFWGNDFTFCSVRILFWSFANGWRTSHKSSKPCLVIILLCAVTLEGPRSSLMTSPSSNYYLGSSMWTLVHQSASRHLQRWWRFVDYEVVWMLKFVCRLQGSQSVDGQVQGVFSLKLHTSSQLQNITVQNHTHTHFLNISCLFRLERRGRRPSHWWGSSSPTSSPTQ